jgi:hypothetical protein
VRDESGLVEARVAWHRRSDEVDVALLVITEPGWRVPVWRHRVRWGWLVTSRAGQVCEALGFPKVVAEPQWRDSHHAVGVINPGALVKAGLYAVEVSNPPAAPGPVGSWWAGMSGAALLCHNLLVGVITTDPKGFDSRRLVAIPITVVISDPEFRRLVIEHCGRGPVVEPVELVGLGEPVRAADSPAGLLRADVADTPFRDRPELDRLQRWCQRSEWSSIRLVVGPGGQGKTRLARHLAGQLVGEGWATVMLAERAGPGEIAVLGEVVVPTLVVVDYAEGRTDQLGAVVEAVERAQEKVRLLLLARTAGAWRTERIDPLPVLEVLGDDRIVLELGPLEPTAEGRAQAWEQALAALAAGMDELGLEGYRDIEWTDLATGLAIPSLEGPSYRTILAVQMHALAALLQAGVPITAVGERPQQVLLAHESRYWSRVADRFGRLRMWVEAREVSASSPTVVTCRFHAPTRGPVRSLATSGRAAPIGRRSLRPASCRLEIGCGTTCRICCGRCSRCPSSGLQKPSDSSAGRRLSRKTFQGRLSHASSPNALMADLPASTGSLPKFRTRRPWSRSGLRNVDCSRNPSRVSWLPTRFARLSGL